MSSLCRLYDFFFFPLLIFVLLSWSCLHRSLFFYFSQNYSWFLLSSYPLPPAFFLSLFLFFFTLVLRIFVHSPSAYLPPLSLSYLLFSICSSIYSLFPWFLYSFRFFFLHLFALVLHVYLLIPLPFICLSFFSLSPPHSISSRLEGYLFSLILRDTAGLLCTVADRRRKKQKCHLGTVNRRYV